MNTELEKLATEVDLAQPGFESLRLTFGHACVTRVEHLLEESEVIECLHVFDRFLRGEVELSTFGQAQQAAERLANGHRGSKSIDGCGHAAVSASYAVANAINGRALQAASYAAYAKIYADGGYGAVTEREAFEPEFRWQVSVLKKLIQSSQRSAQQVLFTHGTSVA